MLQLLGSVQLVADCRDVHQSFYLYIHCSFLYHKPSLSVNLAKNVCTNCLELFQGSSLHLCLGCSGLVHKTVSSSSCQYPVIGPSHWRWTDQNPTGKQWSNQILHHTPLIKRNIQSGLLFMRSNQHLHMPHLWRGMDFIGKGEVLTHTKKMYTVYMKNVSTVL